MLVKLRQKRPDWSIELGNASGIVNLKTYYPLKLCLVDDNMLFANVDSALLTIGRLDVFL